MNLVIPLHQDFLKIINDNELLILIYIKIYFYIIGINFSFNNIIKIILLKHNSHFGFISYIYIKSKFS